ncbi:hypothetical protein DFH09DRAFT_1477815 [Mycena vulgaris]|nr:hypothetical protein DFH09DRAFT_1477815 [Mycena vulgaris]
MPSPHRTKPSQTSTSSPAPSHNSDSPRRAKGTHRSDSDDELEEEVKTEEYIQRDEEEEEEEEEDDDEDDDVRPTKRQKKSASKQPPLLFITFNISIFSSREMRKPVKKRYASFTGYLKLLENTTFRAFDRKLRAKVGSLAQLADSPEVDEIRTNFQVPRHVSISMELDYVDSYTHMLDNAKKCKDPTANLVIELLQNSVAEQSDSDDTPKTEGKKGKKSKKWLFRSLGTFWDFLCPTFATYVRFPRTISGNGTHNTPGGDTCSKNWYFLFKKKKILGNVENMRKNAINDQIAILRNKWTFHTNHGSDYCWISGEEKEHIPLGNPHFNPWAAGIENGACDTDTRPNHKLFNKNGNSAHLAPPTLLQRRAAAANQAPHSAGPVIHNNFTFPDTLLEIFCQNGIAPGPAPAANHAAPSGSVQDQITLLPPHMQVPGRLPITDFCSIYELDNSIRDKLVANGYRNASVFYLIKLGRQSSPSQFSCRRSGPH